MQNSCTLELSSVFTYYAGSSPNSKGNTMPKDMHQKAAEHHDQAAKAHRTAAQQHSSNDHVSAKQQSAQAVINLKQLTSIRRRRTTRANSRNNAIASQQVASAGLRVGAL